jgi:hypothetical protein
MTYRNVNFTRRDYETTNVVAAVSLDGRAPRGEGWQVADESAIDGLTSLWIEGGVRYYGYL